MHYTAKYHELKAAFIPGLDISGFSEEGISCKWTYFQSQNTNPISRERNARMNINPGTIDDESINENRSFIYPVFLKEDDKQKQRNPIVLLHGLNERSWQKYLVWALYLAQYTSRPVILFPIAFHMNRSPLKWGSPRAMAPVLDSRREKLGNTLLTTVANVALSERLSEDPLRFYTSGQQSAADIIQLLTQLKSGTHPLLGSSGDVDFFAYSIGAFLAQILMIGNPGSLLSHSRLFLFCGGAFFDQMNGVSKLIMDQPAFERLRRFYINELDDEIQHSPLLSQSLRSTELGQAFMSMLSNDNNKQFRDDAFMRLKERIFTLALESDKVIPAYGVAQALGFMKNTRITNFPFPCIHENPFPIYGDLNESSLVDTAFENVFSLAAEHLA
jgi:pimeloyl-ACP methyl ester carboxylesterase